MLWSQWGPLPPSQTWWWRPHQAPTSSGTVSCLGEAKQSSWNACSFRWCHWWGEGLTGPGIFSFFGTWSPLISSTVCPLSSWELGLFPPLPAAHHWLVIRSGCQPATKESSTILRRRCLQPRAGNSWGDTHLRAVSHLSQQVGKWMPQSWKRIWGRQHTTESTTITKWWELVF